MKIAFLREVMAGHLGNYIINLMSFLGLSRSLHNNLVVEFGLKRKLLTRWLHVMDLQMNFYPNFYVKMIVLEII